MSASHARPAPCHGSDDAPQTLHLRWAGVRLAGPADDIRCALQTAEGRDDLARLLAGLGVRAPAQEQDLRAALRSGRRFEEDLPRRDGGRARILTRPEGRRIAMTVWMTAPDRSATDASDLAESIRAAPLPIWLRTPDGAVRWRNEACALAEIDLADPRLEAAAAAAAETRAVQSLRIVSANTAALAVAETPGGLGVATPALEGAPAGTLPDHAAFALDQLDLGVAAFGEGRRLLCANAAFRAFWRLSAADLQGEPRFETLLDRMRDSGRLPAVANYRIWREEVAGWVDAKAEAPSEDEWHLADGATIRLQRSSDGEGRTVLGFQDVTRQVTLERSVRRTVSVQRKTLDALDGGVALFDPDGRLRLANPAFAALWMLDPARARVGAHIAEIPAPSAKGDAADAWTELRAAATGGPAETGRRRFRLGGRVLDAGAAPMPDGALLAQIEDRSAAERAETALRERSEALAASAELRAALADCVSVKLRTALTSIGGFAELAALENENPRLRARLSSIREAAADMTRAVTEIEQLAARGAGRADAGPLPAAELLALTADLLARALWTAGAHLERRDESAGARFPGDPEPARQIALSMSLAALDDLPAGGTLNLTAGATAPDAEGRRSATLTAESRCAAERARPDARLARAHALAKEIGATLELTEAEGLRRITLTGAPF